MSSKVVYYILKKFKDYLSSKSVNKSVDKRIEIIKKNNGYRQFPIRDIELSFTKYWPLDKLSRKWVNLFYSVYGTADKEFIPVHIYNKHIEPSLNHNLLVRAYKNKNFYGKYFGESINPKTILRRMNGLFYDSEYQTISLSDESLSIKLIDTQSVILKPTISSGSGKGILKFDRTKSGFFSDNLQLDIGLLANYGQDFIMQEVVKQHDFFRKFNPSSNNTLRVLTYRSIKDDSVNVLHILLRIGAKGLFLDHDNLGGVVISVNDGLLHDFATDVNGNKYTEFNGIDFSKTREVPFYKEIIQFSKDIASEINYGRLLALDLTITEEGKILLVEINCVGNGISQYQYNNGSLFKEFTDEILFYASKYNKKIYLIEV